jgi:signal transduction histidine kinase
MRDAADGHLRKACRLTGAAWAALVGTQKNRLAVLSAYGLNPSRRTQLEKWLLSDAGASWCRGLGDGRRSATRIQIGSKRGPDGAWGFRLQEGHVLLVCSRDLGQAERELWELVAELLRSASGPAREATGRSLQPDAAIDVRQGLDGLLARFVTGEAEAAILAIRHGEQLVVAAERDSGLQRGFTFDLERGPLLRRLQRSRIGVLAHRGSTDWGGIPFEVEASTASWAAVPLVVEDRLVGAVALWSRKNLPEARCRAAAELARQISPNIDVIMSLGEVTTQLQRLATLNEFALAISSAEGVPQLAQRVLEHLGSLYPGYEISLYVPALDGRTLQEFHLVDSKSRANLSDLVGSPVASWFESDGADAPQSAMGSALQRADGKLQYVFPLRYRAASVGALEFRGPAGAELPRYDRSLLAVVASYMAGVVEHGRLRAEAIERAQSLEETVHQLRQAELEASARLRAQQNAESRLVQAAKLVAVGEMAAGVAHELNNPLTTVSGFAELLLEETPADAAYRADLEMVLHEAHRARSVVRRLLDFARQGETARARADINEIVQDVLALMTHFIHTSGVQLELDLGSELPWIALDANQVKQVLLNLLHNALHAMPGGGRLQVRTRMQDRDGRGWIIIDVCDSGVGMEPAEIGRIFDPFYTTRAESGGTGLGLSVTYGIVTDHGGTIEVQSQRGIGSTFSVWLPM